MIDRVATSSATSWFIKDRPGWLRTMKSVIAKNAVSFNSDRMMRRYATEASRR